MPSKAAYRTPFFSNYEKLSLNPYNILFTLSLPKGNPDSEPLIFMISPDSHEHEKSVQSEKSA